MCFINVREHLIAFPVVQLLFGYTGHIFPCEPRWLFGEVPYSSEPGPVVLAQLNHGVCETILHDLWTFCFHVTVLIEDGKQV